MSRFLGSNNNNKNNNDTTHDKYTKYAFNIVTAVPKKKTAEHSIMQTNECIFYRPFIWGQRIACSLATSEARNSRHLNRNNWLLNANLSFASVNCCSFILISFWELQEFIVNYPVVLSTLNNHIWTTTPNFRPSHQHDVFLYFAAHIKFRWMRLIGHFLVYRFIDTKHYRAASSEKNEWWSFASSEPSHL